MSYISKRISALSVLLSLGMQTVAVAALTFIGDSPDLYNEPNLVGVNPFPGNTNPSVLETLYGENNLRRVDDAIDLAFRHTGAVATVKAVARFNNPSIEERFGYFDPSTGFLRTVLQFKRVPPNSFFPVGYNLPTLGDGLIALADSGPVFEVGMGTRRGSNPPRNDFGQDIMVTFEIVGATGHPNNQVGNYVIGWEYFPADDLDFQDLVFEMSGVAPVPEPAALLSLVASLVWLPQVRCRRGSTSLGA